VLSACLPAARGARAAAAVESHEPHKIQKTSGVHDRGRSAGANDGIMKDSLGLSKPRDCFFIT